MRFNILQIYIFYLLVSGCSPKYSTPMSDHSTNNPTPIKISQKGVIPIELSVDKLKVSSLLDSLSGNSIYEGKDNLNLFSIKIYRNAPTKVQSKSNGIITEFTLGVLLGSGRFQGAGELNLTLENNISLTAENELTIVSKIESYNWVKKPKMNLGLFNVNFSSIANLIINLSKEKLEHNINSILNSQLDLDGQIKAIVDSFRGPVKLGQWPIYSQADIEGITIGQFSDQDSLIKLGIGINCAIEIIDTAGIVEKEDLQYNLIPHEIITNHPLPLLVSISENTIDSMLYQNLDRFELEWNKKKATLFVEKVEFRGKKIKLIINSEGGFEAKMQLVGNLNFDYDEQRFSLDVLNIKILKGDLITKSLGSLFKKYIIKQIEQSATITMEESKKRLQTSIQEEIDKFVSTEFKTFIQLNEIKIVDIIIGKNSQMLLLVDSYIQISYI